MVTMDTPTPLTTVEKAALLIEVDLFQEVPSDALAELATRMEETSHAPGEVLLEPDAADARLCVIVEGRVRVQRGDDAVADLSRGAAFGLLAALGLAHQDTVTAAEPCRLLSVAPEEYVDALADSSAFALANLRALGRRLQACEGVLSSPPADGDTR